MPNPAVHFEVLGKIVSVTSIPNMVTFALFADPEGHVVGVVAREVPTAA